MSSQEINYLFAQSLIQSLPTIIYLSFFLFFIIMFKNPLTSLIYRSTKSIKEEMSPSFSNPPTMNTNVTESGGYIILEMDEAKKSIFQDILKGFEDYAKLKGYNIVFSSDTSQPNMFAFKFTILEEGILVSVERVKNDIREYLEKIDSEEPLGPLPVVISQEQHNEIYAKLVNRINFLKYNYQITQNTLNYYTNLISGNSNITYPTANVSPVINIVTHSQDASQRNSHYINSHDGDDVRMEGHKVIGTGNVIGDNSKGIGDGSTVIGDNNRGIVLGDSLAEKSHKLTTLIELITSLESDKSTTKDKQEAIRYLKNVEEEIKESPSPNKPAIEKWFEKANTCIKAADLGKDVLGKTKALYDSFNLSDLTNWISNITNR